MHARQKAIGRPSSIKQPSAVVSQHMHVFHGRHRLESTPNQPGLLIKKTKVIGIALK